MICEEVLKITNPEKILPITDIIHDCKFNKDRIVFDPVSSTLAIEFNYEMWDKKTVLKRILFLKKVKVPIVKYILKIADVEGYQIHEGSQRGPGTEDFFNKIIYNPRQNQVIIIPVIAEAIEIKIKKFEVSIENTCQVVGEKISFSF